MNRYILVFLSFLIGMGVSVKINAHPSGNEIISEIKLSKAYINATGTAKINDEAMDDARNRLKNEIYDWLNSVLQDQATEKSKIQNYKEWMKGMVKIQTDIRKRPTFNDTVKAYAGVIAQGEEVKFIDRKIGSLIRVFAYVPKNKILPGVTLEKELPEETLSKVTEVKEQPTTPKPVYGDGDTIVLEESEDVVSQLPVKEEEEPLAVPNEQQKPEEVQVDSTPDAETPVQPQKINVDEGPDEAIKAAVLKLKTSNELNKYLAQLKQEGKLKDYGTSTGKDIGAAYIIVVDHHKIVRAKLWYTGSEVLNLENGEKENLSSILEKYPNLVWFQTKS